jgi:hypothetical protein
MANREAKLAEAQTTAFYRKYCFTFSCASPKLHPGANETKFLNSAPVQEEIFDWGQCGF